MSGANFSSFNTDDPDTGPAGDPTLTPLNLFPLPVTLLSIRAAKENNGVTLSWKVAGEQEKQENQEKLTNNFKAALQNASIDKDMLYITTVEAYRSFIENFHNSAYNAVTGFAESDFNNRQEMTRVMNQLTKYVYSVVPKDSLSPGLFPGAPLQYLQPQFDGYNADYLKETFYAQLQPTVRLRDGSDSGFLGFIANFLIKTNSQELVLLIGMRGFGLLGAAAAAFAKEDRQEDPTDENPDFLEVFKTQPLIPNFWKVLVRGFLAAILIYIATKGGIPILTANTSSDPNDYVLLFLCFIGAVYSNKVWEKVSGKI